jgi:hypothetical protein
MGALRLAVALTLVVLAGCGDDDAAPTAGGSDGGDAAVSDASFGPDTGPPVDATLYDSARFDALADALADTSVPDEASPADAFAVDAPADAGADAAGDASACETGTAEWDGGCSPVAPRPIAPLSTATVTSRRPTLRWALAAGIDGARVELCRDRACTTPIATIDATGTSAQPSADLPAGVVFWRAFGRAAGVVGSIASPTWELFVGSRSSPIDGSWGTVLDVNGDGLADVAVGALFANGRQGRVDLYSGATTGLPATAALTLPSPDDGGAFGAVVTSGGDVDGDGYVDLVAGAPQWSGFTGRAHVFLGGPTGLSSSSSTLESPGGMNGLFGETAVSAGDVSGDGYADVAISMRATTSAPGNVYLYLGGPAGLVTAPVPLDATLRGTVGFSLGGGFDVNGDGYADLLVGDPGAQHVYVYLGGQNGLVAPPAATLGPGLPDGGSASSQSFGASVAGADVNGDGYFDVVVGDGLDYVYLYSGSATGVGATPSVTIYGVGHSSCGQADSYGESVANAGDVNADGYADVIIGAPDTVTWQNSLPIGSASVFFGSSSGLVTVSWIDLCGPLTDQSEFGTSVAGLGDVDGDGFGDVAVGAPYYAGQGFVGIFPGGDAGTTTAGSPYLLDTDGGQDLFGISVY